MCIRILSLIQCFRQNGVHVLLQLVEVGSAVPVSSTNCLVDHLLHSG